MVVMCYVKINRLLMTAPHVEEPPSKPPSDWKCGWWYGIWTFAPIVWFVPNLMISSWPPTIGELVVNTMFLATGSIAALHTVRHGRFGSLRIAAGVVGTLYITILCFSLAFNGKKLIEHFS